MLLAFTPRQRGLRRRVPDPSADFRVDRQAQSFCHGPGQLQCLIETALPQPFGVQRQRNDQVGTNVAGMLGEKPAEIRRRGQAVRVLEGLDQQTAGKP